MCASVWAEFYVGTRDLTSGNNVTTMDKALLTRVGIISKRKPNNVVITLGLMASLLVALMAFTIKRQNVVRISVALGVITTLQYILLGEWGTVWLTGISALYAVGLMNSHRFPVLAGKRMAYILVAFYTLGFVWLNGVSLSWGLVSYAASILGALMLLIENPLKLKYAMFANGILWAIFQLASGAYGQLPGELLYVAGIVFSIIVLKRAQRKGKDLHKVPEFSDVIKSKFQKASV